MPRTFEETGLVRAQAKWVRSSARKARIVLEHIRGLNATQARTVLAFTTRDVAKDIDKVLASAIANAVNNHGLDEETLVVHEAFADEGVTAKRFKPRARGRAMTIRKRTSHVTILLRSTAPIVVETAPAATKVATAKTTPKAASAKAEEVVVEASVAGVEEAVAIVEDAPAKPKRTRTAKPKVEKDVTEDDAAAAEAFGTTEEPVTAAVDDTNTTTEPTVDAAGEEA